VPKLLEQRFEFLQQLVHIFTTDI